jgi:hypothetical protein
MSMAEGQIYRCQNRECGCEIRVTKASSNTNSNPRCCCGAEMKKPYTRPVLRSLQSKTEGPSGSENDPE